jgi:hypothetical protein
MGKYPLVIGIGVRQGDDWSATLFNLILHKAPINLEYSNTILNKLTQICGYANDILVIARTLKALEILCVDISREASRVGLVGSPDKTKYVRFSVSPGVTNFIYLGTVISNDNSIEKGI